MAEINITNNIKAMTTILNKKKIKRKKLVIVKTEIDKRKIKGNKRDILRKLGYTSISQVYKSLGLNNGVKNEKFKQGVDELKQIDYEIDEDMLKTKKNKWFPNIIEDEESALQGYALTKSITNRNDYLLDVGLNLVYEFVNEIKKQLKLLGSIKIKIAYKIQFEKDDRTENEFILISNIDKGVIVINNINEIKNILENLTLNMLNDVIPSFEGKGSGWRLIKVNKINLNIVKYNPIKGSSYIELPKCIKDKVAVINIKNDDDK